jgi:pimeloyl-ACP methyl ester carboxylesterase
LRLCIRSSIAAVAIYSVGYFRRESPRGARVYEACLLGFLAMLLLWKQGIDYWKVGLAYALDHPENVKRLVLFNTWMWSFAGERSVEWVARILGGRLGRYLYERRAFSVKVMLRRAVADRRRYTPEVFWLRALAASNLPIPRLIAVEIDRSNPPDIDLIKTALSQNFEGVTLDDHRRWQAEIRTLTRSAALGGIAVLGLVAAATIAVIVSATRSAMASNREIIEVLHFVGANERFISSEFERHFLGLGVRAGLMGAVAAAIAFLLLPLMTHMLGGGTVTAAETQRLIGSGELDLPGYFLCVLVVIVVACLCMITSRLGVIRVLKSYA